MARVDSGLWSLLVGSLVVALAGRHLAFAVPWQRPSGWEFAHFFKALGVFLMFAGMIAWLTAAGMLVLRIGRSGRL